MNLQSFQLVEAELALAGFSPDDEQRLRRLEERRITPDKELTPVEFLFRLHGKPCFARGELTGLSGKAKSGKTFVCSILMALCFRNEVLSVQRIEPRKLHVLWYDTEQSDESTQDILKNRILQMIGGHTDNTDTTDNISANSALSAGQKKSVQSVKSVVEKESVQSVQSVVEKNNSVVEKESVQSVKSVVEKNNSVVEKNNSVVENKFDVYNVRRDAVSERLPMLEAAVRYRHPDLVILDGIRDLVADINDGVVAQNVVERLMHLAQEHHCCIVCVLHQNKSIEDRNLRGWIGTELKNKAFEVYECAKSSERIFTWSQTDTRKYDIAEGLSFAVNDDGIPYRCTEQQLIEAQFEAQRKAVAKMEKSGGRSGKPYADLNPKYAHKEGRKHVFDVKLLFTDIMQPGQAYTEEALKTEIYAKTNAIKDKLHDEMLRQAVTEKIILCCTNPFGKKEYLLPVPEPVQQDLPF